MTCPFCRSKKEPRPYQFPNGQWQVICVECGAGSPTANSADDARASWLYREGKNSHNLIKIFDAISGANLNAGFIRVVMENQDSPVAKTVLEWACTAEKEAELAWRMLDAFRDMQITPKKQIGDSGSLRPTDQAYLALLRMRADDEWRAVNQDIFARLRDEIAADWQWDTERVQNHFEDVARDGFQREIPVVAGFVIDLADTIEKAVKYGDGNYITIAAEVFNFLHPYLRTTEPVTTIAPSIENIEQAYKEGWHARGVYNDTIGDDDYSDNDWQASEAKATVEAMNGLRNC